MAARSREPSAVARASRDLSDSAQDSTIGQGRQVIVRSRNQFPEEVNRTAAPTSGSNPAAIPDPCDFLSGGGSRAERGARLEELVVSQLCRLTRQHPTLDLLGVPPIEAGLDSLLAIQLRNELEGALRVEVSPAMLLQAPSLRALAANLLDTLEDSRRKAAAPLSPAVAPPPSTDAAVRRRSVELALPDSSARPAPEIAGAAEAGQAATPVLRLPTSALQKGVWIACQLAGTNAAYNLAHADRILGALNVSALERAIQGLVDRHPGLRTALEVVDGSPRQVVHAQAPLRLSIADLSNHPAARDSGALRTLIREHVQESFDLAKAPLARAVLFRISSTEHVLLLIVHHLIFDGWSHSIMTREISAMYAGFAAARELSLPPPGASYVDYVKEETAGLASAQMQGHLNYWRARLAGFEPTELPTNRPRPAQMSLRGDLQRFSLPAGELAQLKQLARTEKCTLFIVLLAAFQTVLMRHSGRDDVSVGSPSAGRYRARFPDAIGFFSNTLVMRTNLAGNPTFRELLGRTRETVLQALAHQEFPTDRLVGELALPRDTNRNPLYAIVFALQSQPEAVLDLGAAQIEAIPIHAGTSRLDLWVTLRESEGVLHGEIEYRTELFEVETIRRVAAHFQTLVSGVVKNPQTRLADLPLLDDTERRSILRDWNDTARPYPVDRPIHELISERAAAWPDATAVIAEDAAISYAALETAAGTLAQRLRALGIGRDVPVAVCLERSVELVVAIMAVLKAGGAFLPLDPDYPAVRLQSMLSDSRAPVILTQGALQGLIAAATTGLAAIVLCVDGDHRLPTDAPSPVPAARVSADDGAYLIYTSGSTGQPKGVLVPHRGLCNHICWMADQLQLTSEDRILQKTSICFDASLWEIFTPLLVGATVVLARPGEHRDVAHLARTIIKQKITVMFMVPSALRILLDEPALRAGSTLRYLISGGEALDRALARDVFRVFSAITLGNYYGPTEASDDATCFELRSPPQGAGLVPIGRPIANVRCHVLDEHLQVVPIGAPGELFIGGAGLARGYLNQPELTAQRFIADPFEAGQRLYRTGDLVRYLPDGTLEFLGRTDTQVKVRGFRIELGEIEAALNSVEGVRQSAVVAREDGLGGKRLDAYVTGSDLDIAAVFEALRTTLPANAIPSAIVPLETLPSLPNGKVDRNRLPAPQTSSVQPYHVAPRGEIEETLSKFWQEVLQRPRVGAEDNFFELGGHSLLATQVASRIRRTFEIELPLRAIFESPTVSGLARQIRERQAASARIAELPIEPIGRVGALMTSFSQRRMWFVQQMEPSGTAYNMPFAARIKGAVDQGALTAALQCVVNKYEAFRTTFEFAETEPVQLVAPKLSLALREIDLRHFPEQERLAETARIFRAESMRPFDLATGPLFRFLLVRLDEADYAILWLVHHAISDQWSAGIVGRELATLYAAFARGESPVLEPPAVEYADFAAWQRKHLGGSALDPQLAYWRSKLRGVAPLALQIDKPRPPHQTFHGSWVFETLSPVTIAAFKRFCAERRVTPFMALLACFKLLLSRHTGQDDIPVGCPVANRTRVATESLVGTLVNTLVMRTSLAGDPAFRELLARTRETALEAFANQDVPFERLVEELRTDRDTGRAPLVQVLFNVPNAPMRKLDLHGLQVEIFDFDNGSTQFELAASADLDFTGRVALTYSTDLFTQATAQRLLGQYTRLLEQVTADSTKRVSEYQLVSADELRLMLDVWNRTVREYPEHSRTDELISAQAALTPGAIAVGCGGVQLTYASLETRSNRLAHYLRFQGLAAGQRVGVCMERSEETVVALLAVQKAGATYVPLDPAFPADRLRYMAQDADLSLTITHSSLKALLVNFPGRMLFLDECRTGIASQTMTSPGYVGSAGDLAYILYTSGTTGRPKGVEIPCRALTNLLCAMREFPGCNSTDTLLSVTTLSFDISALELYLPLITGARVELARPEEVSDPRLLIERMTNARPTVMQATPTTWRMLLEAGWEGDPNLKVLCGGEPLSRQLADKLLERCGSLWNMYGPTETTVWSSCARIDRHADPITIGRPIANTFAYILDRTLQPVPSGATGELWLGGDGVARGYRNQPELTQERFVPDPFRNVAGARMYRTGDLARFLPDGRIVHLGRLDMQVKIRGFRIEPGEIETVLAKHPAVSQVAVASRADRDGRQQLVGYVVPRTDGDQPTLESLRKLLQRSLPAYMLPARFVFLESLPLTANGKTDIKRLPDPVSSEPSDQLEPVRALSPIEVRLMELWRHVLNNESIGIHDNFFDVGGYSLKAVELFSYVHETLGKRLPLATLFQAPTVAQMARVLQEGGVQPSARCLVAIQTAGRDVPLFAVPGVGGDVLVFAKLARILGRDRPFFGLQAVGLDGVERPIASVEESARRYVQEIRSARGRGPYFVAGTCTGGVYAFEVAQQLQAMGEKVTLVIMESWHPDSYTRDGRAAEFIWPLRFIWARLALYAKAIYSLPASEWGVFLKSKARRLASALFHTDPAQLQGDGTFSAARVVRTTLQAVASYRPKPYRGSLLNVIAGGRQLPPGLRDTRQVWTELALGPRRTVVIPAEDSGRLFVSPYVQRVADLLNEHARTDLPFAATKKESSPAGWSPPATGSAERQ